MPFRCCCRALKKPVGCDATTSVNAAMLVTEMVDAVTVPVCKTAAYGIDHLRRLVEIRFGIDARIAKHPTGQRKRS